MFFYDSEKGNAQMGVISMKLYEIKKPVQYNIERVWNDIRMLN